MGNEIKVAWITLGATALGAIIAAVSVIAGNRQQFKHQVAIGNRTLCREKLEEIFLATNDIRNRLRQRLLDAVARRAEKENGETIVQMLDRLRMLIYFYFPKLGTRLEIVQTNCAYVLQVFLNSRFSNDEDPEEPKKLTDAFQEADKSVVTLQQAITDLSKSDLS